MKVCTATGLGLLGMMAFAPALWAQPAVPAAAPAAPTKNLWTFLLPSKEQCAHAKEGFCKSGVGQLVGNAAKPLSGMTGGLIGGKCGVPTADDIAKLKEQGKLDSAEGAAAQIKKSEAEAKARREAVRYLGTVECNYWPEAKAALINGLRADPSECVRYEAALALARGCCCNKEVMEALKHSINCSTKDGHPAESSERVRQAAGEALARCAEEVTELLPVDPIKGPKEGPGPKEGSKPRATTKASAPAAGEPRRQGVFGVLAASAAAPRREKADVTPAAVPHREKADVTPVAAREASAPRPATAPLQQPTTIQPQVRKGLLQILASGKSSRTQAAPPNRTPATFAGQGPLLLTTVPDQAAPPNSLPRLAPPQSVPVEPQP